MPTATMEPPTSIGASTLSVSQLRRRRDPSHLPFTTTADLPDSPLGFGQDRAVAAIRQAANRVHTEKALLVALLGGGATP